MKRVASILIALLMLAAPLSLAEAGGMQKGSKGDDVAALQRSLITLGYLEGAADGIFGNMTQQAVIALQSDYSLTLTGIVGDSELNAISDAFQAYAARAVVVAMTNAQAPDVRAADGVSYDTSRFHRYADETGYLLTLESEGTWTTLMRQSWGVENIRMRISDSDKCLVASMYVSFDGANYILSNVTRIIARPEDLDSDDPTKVDEAHLEPSADAPYLTVPFGLVREERASVIRAQEAALAQEREAMRDSWIEAQFSAEDGSHKGLEVLIRARLTNPASYQHIETTWVEIVDGSVQTKINMVLKASKFEDQVEIGDLFIDTEFTTTGSGGVTYTAYAIMRYGEAQPRLLGIVGMSE